MKIYVTLQNRIFTAYKLNKKNMLGMLCTVCLCFSSSQGISAPTEPPFILMIYASGGWDQTLVFDPKMGSTSIDIQTGSYPEKSLSGVTYAHHPSRPAVKKWFDDFGANAAIINGIYTPNLNSQRAFGSLFTTIPREKYRPVDFLTYYAANLRPGYLAPHIVFDAPYASGDYSYFTTKLTKQRLTEYLTEAISGAENFSSDQESKLLNLQKTVWSTALNSTHQNSLDAEKLRAIYGHLSKESALGQKIRTISSKLGPQGAESDFLRNAKFALELFADGSSLCATLQFERNQYWDLGAGHFEGQSRAFQDLFTNLSSLLSYARQRGLLDRLTIILTSDSGKAPKLNPKGGRDPWPYTSILLWGSIFRGGTVHGATDPFLRGVAIDPVFGNIASDARVVPTMSHVFASIFAASGMTSSLIFPEISPIASILNFSRVGALQ